MKKKVVVCLALLLCAVLLTVSLTACGGGEPTADEIKAAFEAEGYKVTVSTVGGYSTVGAIKGTDIFTVACYSKKSEADAAIDTAKAAAELLGMSVKQDGKNIYYGSDAGNAIYEKI